MRYSIGRRFGKINFVHEKNIKIYQPSIKDYLIGLFHSIVKLYPIQFFLFFSLDAYKDVKKIADNYDILFGSRNNRILDLP